ncbi:MAG: class I SAM-dependent methyltransferase [Bacteroidota bacterium]
MSIQNNDFSKLEYEGWQRVAGKYLDNWANLTQQFIDPLLNAAGVKKEMKVLDVACGPGIVSKKIHERKAFPVGIDFSPEMIKLAKSFYPYIEFHEGDAQELQFGDTMFDAVVMNFGMLHIPRPLQAMKEAYRVLRNGGKFAFTVWASAARSPASKVMNDAKEKYADMNVPMPAAPPYDYFENRENSSMLLSQAGFDSQSLHYETRLVNWLVPSAGFLFDAELNAGVRNAAFLRQQSAEVLGNIKAAVEQGMEQFKVDNGYALPFLGCIIAARK